MIKHAIIHIEVVLSKKIIFTKFAIFDDDVMCTDKKYEFLKCAFNIKVNI